MRKNSATKRALRAYAAYNPKYFPLKFVQTIFDNLTPYFNLWLSSEIVTALARDREKKVLYTLVGITLLGNLIIAVVGAFLERMTENELEILNNNEEIVFNRKTLSLDYSKIEDPAVQQHRRKIVENSWINRYGVVKMRFDVESTMIALVNIVLSLILFVEMVSGVITTQFHWTGVFILGAIILCMTCNILSQFIHSQKMAEGWKRIGEKMLESNRFGRGYFPMGLDNRIYKQQPYILKLRMQSTQSTFQCNRDRAHQDVKYSFLVILFAKLCELASYLLICFYCALGIFPVGSIIKYVGYLNKLTTSIGDLFLYRGEFKTNEPFLQTYLDYFDIPNEMYQGSLAVEKRSDKKFDIEFKNVSFRYPGSETLALKNINLNLRVGERLAVVGMNGSGKTTFIKLLCRLYDPTEGEIFMNDFNIRKYDYRQYLDIFSVVFQDFSLLAVPLGNNVASAEVWNTEKAEQLLDEVGFGKRYSEMPKKLDTPLYKNFDEDGVNISGGEAQKIALARALYKDAPFIILDEPTAALDPLAEAEIYQKFDEIVGDKTAIYISHRLSSCRFCDKIAVFHQGEIVQLGTHEELLADPAGQYYKLWNAQAQYYVEKTA